MKNGTFVKFYERIKINKKKEKENSCNTTKNKINFKKYSIKSCYKRVMGNSLYFFTDLILFLL